MYKKVQARFWPVKVFLSFEVVSSLLASDLRGVRSQIGEDQVIRPNGGSFLKWGQITSYSMTYNLPSTKCTRLEKTDCNAVSDIDLVR